MTYINYQNWLLTFYDIPIAMEIAADWLDDLYIIYVYDTRTGQPYINNIIR